MSLFSSIQLARNALTAAEIGLHVAGNNIANANTPGYVRQTVEYAAAPPQKVGALPIGLGVEILAIRQQSDRFLEERVRSATSDLANAEQQEKTYLELEGLVGALNDTGLGKSLTDFFGSVQEVLNQPESTSVRGLAVLRGAALSDDMNRLADTAGRMQMELNDRVGSIADQINSLVEEIARLNVQIASIEGGETTPSDAVGLRDNRLMALKELSKLIDIRSFEQPSGTVTVMAGGDFLVADGTSRGVRAATDEEAGNNFVTVRLTASDSALQISSGELAGLLEARDEILGGFLSDLDGLARALAFEFNKLYSGGQGLIGNSDITSQAAIENDQAALDQAGLSFTPTNGSFQVLVRDSATGLTTTHNIAVRLNGFEDDTTLRTLTEELDAIDGLEAMQTADGRLRIRSTQRNLQFAFASDSSGALAALGLATFFTGDSAATLGVHDDVRAQPQLFAASGGGIGVDTQNALLLGDFLRRPLASAGGTTLAGLYDSAVNSVSQGSASARSVAEGFRAFHGTLEGQAVAMSGVSIDEEAVKILALQRMFQASAKFISTLSDLMEVLVSL
jgi:flagellar hook-associated protein 1 FlgK